MVAVPQNRGPSDRTVGPLDLEAPSISYMEGASPVVPMPLLPIPRAIVADDTRAARPFPMAVGRVNWLTVNSAPCGSRTRAVRVQTWLADRIVAPNHSALAALSSRAATVNVTYRSLKFQAPGALAT